MAVFKFADGVDPFLGRRAGTVFSMNSSGPILRMRRKPIYRRTVINSEIRASFRKVVGFWRGLTEPEKQSWRDVVDDFIRVNPIGEVFRPQGPQLQIEQNQPLSLAGSPQVKSGSLKIIFPVRLINPSILTLSPFRLWVYLDDYTIPSDYILKFWASVVNFGERENDFPGKFKLIQSTEINETPYYDLTSQYMDAYKTVPEINFQYIDSTFISVAIQLLHKPTGQQSVTDQVNIPQFFF